MSSISFCSDASMMVSGSVRRRRTSSPYLRIGRTVKSTSPFFEALDHRLDGVLRAFLVELVEDLADAGIFCERVVEFLLVEAEQLGRLRSGDRRGARLSGEHADFAEEIALAEFREIDAALLTAGVDLDLATRDHVHRGAGLPFRDDDVALAMLLELHLFDERSSLLVIEDLEERTLWNRPAEHRLAFDGCAGRGGGGARRVA